MAERRHRGRQDQETDKLVREIHEAIVGTVNGNNPGINGRLKAIDDRHKAEDEDKKFARWKSLAKEVSRVAAGFFGGVVGGNVGR